MSKIFSYIMLIYKNNDIVYCYIHIPKNSGKFIRKRIEKDSDNTVIKKFWNIQNDFDMAHIPFMLKNNYIDFLTGVNINYYTYIRNPYNRIISAFFYKNKKCKVDDFKRFIKNDLIKYDFNKKFNMNIIHYYPQYMFICDDNFEINKVHFEKLENITNFNIREYNLSDYFNLKIIKIINKVYKKDFKIFNYEIIKGI